MKLPKELCKRLVLIVCSTLHLSMGGSYLGDIYGILDTDDVLIAERQEGPALHSVPGDSPAWESYNRWLCFPTSALRTDCRDHVTDLSWASIDPEERDGNGFYAVMEVDYGGNLYRFESPGWIFPEKCLAEVDRIKKLTEGQAGFCVFASKWPSDEEIKTEIGDEFSIWAVYGIKTRAGRSMAPIYDPEFCDEKSEEAEACLEE